MFWQQYRRPGGITQGGQPRTGSRKPNRCHAEFHRVSRSRCDRISVMLSGVPASLSRDAVETWQERSCFDFSAFGGYAQHDDVLRHLYQIAKRLLASLQAACATRWHSECRSPPRVVSPAPHKSDESLCVFQAAGERTTQRRHSNRYPR